MICNCTGDCKRTGYCRNRETPWTTQPWPHPNPWPNPAPVPYGWVCPKCNSVNAPHVPGCSCG